MAVFLFFKLGKDDDASDFLSNSVELTTTLKEGAILGFLDFV